MLRVFDFICPDGHKNELFVSDTTDETKCPECDKLAQRIISAPRKKARRMVRRFSRGSNEVGKEASGEDGSRA